MKTSLQAGKVVRALLLDDAAFKTITEKVYPVSTDEALLPYVVYRRAKLNYKPVKVYAGPESVEVEVVCYASTYNGSIALAEAVRGALEVGVPTEAGGMLLRGSTLVDSDETWEADAYVQRLVFEMRLQADRSN